MDPFIRLPAHSELQLIRPYTDGVGAVGHHSKLPGQYPTGWQEYSDLLPYGYHRLLNITALKCTPETDYPAMLCISSEYPERGVEEVNLLKLIAF